MPPDIATAILANFEALQTSRPCFVTLRYQHGPRIDCCGRTLIFRFRQVIQPVLATTMVWLTQPLLGLVSQRRRKSRRVQLGESWPAELSARYAGHCGQLAEWAALRSQESKFADEKRREVVRATEIMEARQPGSTPGAFLR